MRNEFNDKRKTKSLDEMNYYTFITKNLDDLLNLFQFDKTPQNENLVGDDVLQALDLLFEGSTNNLQSTLSLNLMLKQPNVLAQFVS
jgi:hypothetical protein